MPKARSLRAFKKATISFLFLIILIGDNSNL
jgi:hypothetical protein